MPKSVFTRVGLGLVVVVVGVAGCTTSNSGSGGGGGGGGSGSSNSTATQSSVSATTGGDPTTTPCSKNPCDAGDLCAVCHYALGEGHQCHAKEAPGNGSFACDWLACGPGEACVHVPPSQDGCFDAACEPLPQDCAANPTCACVKDALENISPDGFYDYQVSSCAIEGGHAIVTATVQP